MKNLIFAFLLVAFSACSKNEAGETIPGADLPKLTDVQKDDMQHFSQEFADVNHMTSKHFSIDTRALSKKIKKWKPVTVSSKGTSWATEIDKAIADGDCTMTVVKSGPDVDAKNMDQPYSLKAEMSDAPNHQCPIYSVFQFSMEPKNFGASKGTLVFDLNNKYLARDPSLLDASKISQYNTNFKGEMTMIGGQQYMSATFAGKGTTTFTTAADLGNKVTLVTQLDITMRGKSEADMGVEMQIVSDYKFKRFRAVGVIRGSTTSAQKEMEVVYYINGDRVTQEEYMAFFSSAITNTVSKTVQNHL